MFMRKLINALVTWCSDTSEAARIERTIVQGVIGVLMGVLSALPEGVPIWLTILVIPIIMVILTVIQAQIAKANGDQDA